MYEFHYNYIKQKLPRDWSKLFFTDTDCLAYSIYTGNLNEAIYQGKYLFDFSGYEKASPYLNVENKKGIGKMKDGMGGILTREFVGFSPKMYSISTVK